MKRRQVLAGSSGLSITAPFLNAGQTTSGSLLASNTLTEEGRIRFENESQRFVYTFDYDIPSNISELTIEINKRRRDGVSVLETKNVSRQNDITFVWSGGASPQIILERKVGGKTLDDGYYGTYTTDGVALADEVRTRLPFRYRGEAPTRKHNVTFEGDGFSGDGFVFAGPHATYSETVNGTELTIVVPEITKAEVPHEELLEAYKIGEQNITPLLPRDQMTVFAIPWDWHDLKGQAVRTSVIINGPLARVEDIDSVATHEYIHTSFGTFGSGEMYWFREASAEYYGYLLAYNAGAENFEAFIRTAETDRFQDAVLTDTESMRRSSADYQKGAHVLAALDAEIQDRSNGDATLLDALHTGNHNLSTYEGFSDAVAEVATDSDITEWLDQYVQSSDLPDIPSESSYFSWGTREPEPTQPEPAPEPSMWDTEIGPNSNIETTDDSIAFTVAKCSSGMATRSIGSEATKLSFEYEMRPSTAGWEQPYCEVNYLTLLAHR